MSGEFDLRKDSQSTKFEWRLWIFVKLSFRSFQFVHPLIDFTSFSVRFYLPLLKKDSITHMHSLVVYVKEGFPFAWDSGGSYLCFQLALLQAVSYFCFLCWSCSIIFMYSFWFISSNISEYSAERCISPHFFFVSPFWHPPFFGNIHSPSWHPSQENTRFYDDTPESGKLKTI